MLLNSFSSTGPVGSRPGRKGIRPQDVTSMETWFMQSSNPGLALLRYFSGLTEHVFQSRLGVADPPLVDYVSDLLSRFVRLETLNRVRDVRGRPLTQVADMLTEAGLRVGEASRAVHRHVGDFTLFWTGIYPEALHKLRAPDQKDHFVDYCAQGKKAYLIASTIEAGEADETPSEILARLSHQFELCAYGLREVRRAWERRDDVDPPAPLLLN